MSNDTNAIGLHTASATQLAEHLNILLANYQTFYMNARGYHWNVKGNQFFELHVKFEETYTDLLTKVDEIAERILSRCTPTVTTRVSPPSRKTPTSATARLASRAC